MQTKLIKLKKLNRYIMPCQALILLHVHINFLDKFSSGTIKFSFAKYIKDCKMMTQGLVLSWEKLILVYHHNTQFNLYKGLWYIHLRTIGL